MANDADALRKYRDTLKGVINKTNDKAIERIIVPPANKMLATIRNRIQVDKERSDGRKIGEYSTESIYAGQNEFDKRSSFKPQGKAGKPKKGAKAPKTMYLPEGYKQLRAIQGKPTDGINLTYRGDLMNSYQQQLLTNSVVQGLVSEQESLKRQGLEGRFGKILTPQQKEIETYKKEVAEGEKDRIINAFKNA